jgi:hypothetical protein
MFPGDSTITGAFKFSDTDAVFAVSNSDVAVTVTAESVETLAGAEYSLPP